MNLFVRSMKNEEKKEGGDGGGAPKPEVQPSAPKGDPPPKAEGSNLDQFGYEKPAASEGDKGKEGDPAKKSEQKADPETPPAKSATGYGDDDPPVEPKKDEPAPPPLEKIKDDELGYELEVKDLFKEEADQILSIAKKHKLSKEAAQELVNVKKAEIESDKKAYEKYKAEKILAMKKQKADWTQELKNDPTFGGENYGNNVLRVDKVLDQFMPNTKKKLTEGGLVLPPYVMRDLASVANHLFQTEKLVHGEKGDGGKEKTEEKQKSPLDFYQ